MEFSMPMQLNLDDLLALQGIGSLPQAPVKGTPVKQAPIQPTPLPEVTPLPQIRGPIKGAPIKQAPIPAAPMPMPAPLPLPAELPQLPPAPQTPPIVAQPNLPPAPVPTPMPQPVDPVKLPPAPVAEPMPVPAPVSPLPVAEPAPIPTPMPQPVAPPVPTPTVNPPIAPEPAAPAPVVPEFDFSNIDLSGIGSFIPELSPPPVPTPAPPVPTPAPPVPTPAPTPAPVADPVPTEAEMMLPPETSLPLTRGDMPPPRAAEPEPVSEPAFTPNLDAGLQLGDTMLTEPASSIPLPDGTSFDLGDIKIPEGLDNTMFAGGPGDFDEAAPTPTPTYTPTPEQLAAFEDAANNLNAGYDPTNDVPFDINEFTEPAGDTYTDGQLAEYGDVEPGTPAIPGTPGGFEMTPEQQQALIDYMENNPGAFTPLPFGGTGYVPDVSNLPTTRAPIVPIAVQNLEIQQGAVPAGGSVATEYALRGNVPVQGPSANPFRRPETQQGIGSLAGGG